MQSNRVLFYRTVAARRRTSSAEAVLRVLTTFSAQRTQLGITEIARLIGFYKSRVYRALMALAGHGFVRRVEGSLKFELGPKVLELGLIAGEKLEMGQLAAPVMRELAAKLRGTAILRVLIGEELVAIKIFHSPEPLRLIHNEGEKFPFYYGAPGKVFCAYMPEAERDRLLRGRRLQRFTPKSITDGGQFLRELEGVRRRGFAFSDEEGILGVRALAAPVRDHHQKVVAALSIGIPTMRFPKRRVPEVAAEVGAAAGEISRLLGAP